MKRLNEDELNARIHTFLDRKMQEFPELRPGKHFELDEQSARAARNHTDIFRIASRLGIHWHHAPRTA